eukprot:3950890-Pleurochrysis_carterae.AAC.1
MFSDRRACGAGCASARKTRPAMTEDSGCRSRNSAPKAINKTAYAGTVDREKRMMDVRSGIGEAIAPDSPANRKPR